MILAADKEQCQIIGYITDMTKGWRDGTTWIRGAMMPTDVKITDASKIFIESAQVPPPDGGEAEVEQCLSSGCKISASSSDNSSR